MKTKEFILMVLAILFSIGGVLYSDSESDEQRAYLGVSLDMRLLPELLTKHLGLSPDQGIRINNVQKDSAADKAGLERDDIIVGFEGKPVEDNEQFAEAVRKAGVGKEVTLEIIHLGERKKIKLKLGQFKGGFNWDNWKYPPEPEIMQWWRPGKVFRLKPDDRDWMEITLPEVETHIKNLFKELYSFQHSDNGVKYEITIEGNPEDEDTLITVRISDPDGKITEYQATVGEIDKLPEKYRRPAKEALEKAVKKSRERKPWSYKGILPAPSPPEPEAWRRYFDFEKLEPRPFERDRILDRMEKRVRELQERLEQLEKRQEELLDRLPEESNKQRPKKPEKPFQQEKEKVSI